MHNFVMIAILCLGISTELSANPGDWNYRLELSVGLHSWPDVEDLEHVSSSKLDKLRFNVACGVHFPLNQNSHGDFLVGVDFGLFPNKNNPFTGGGFVVPSVKWLPSEGRQWSLDAGYGFYQADFGGIAGDGLPSSSDDAWNKRGHGGFVGGTWNFGSPSLAGNSGLMLSFKIHFLDLGFVDGGDLQTPLVLSSDAGSLNRGFYQLNLGYRRE